MGLENIKRTIGYLIIFAINLGLYIFLHSHFYFMLLIILGITPIFSILMAKYLRDKIKVEVKVGVSGEIDKNSIGIANEYGYCNETSYFYIKICNPTYFVSLDAKLTLVVENTFFKTSGKQLISVPIHMKEGYGLSFPVMATLPGLVSVNVKSIRIKDLLGICFFEKKDVCRGELPILPKMQTESEYEGQSLQSGMIESEESTKRGNDFSDVQEIREYIPGDKLMSIHWKLSAKTDKLMVKDRVGMSDMQLVVVPELCGSSKLGLAQVLSATYSVIYDMIKDKTTVKLMYWSVAGYEYKEKRIDYERDLNEAFVQMFYEKTYEDPGLAAINMAGVHPEIKAFVYICADGSGAHITVKEND